MRKQAVVLDVQKRKQARGQAEHLARARLRDGGADECAGSALRYQPPA